MSVKRLKQMENIIQCGTKDGRIIRYDPEDINELLSLLNEELKIQDRSLYASAYYAKNKKKMDERAKVYYAAKKLERLKGDSE